MGNEAALREERPEKETAGKTVSQGKCRSWIWRICSQSMTLWLKFRIKFYGSQRMNEMWLCSHFNHPVQERYPEFPPFIVDGKIVGYIHERWVGSPVSVCSHLPYCPDSKGCINWIRHTPTKAQSQHWPCSSPPHLEICFIIPSMWRKTLNLRELFFPQSTFTPLSRFFFNVKFLRFSPLQKWTHK